MRALTTTAPLLALLLASTCMGTSHAATICKGGPACGKPPATAGVPRPRERD
jgi:hypothetical protein